MFQMFYMSAVEQKNMHILFQLDCKIYETHTSGTIGITIRTIVLQEQDLYCGILCFYYQKGKKKWSLGYFFKTVKAFILVLSVYFQENKTIHSYSFKTFLKDKYFFSVYSFIFKINSLLKAFLGQLQKLRMYLEVAFLCFLCEA